MSETDPLAPVLGATDSQHPAQHGPQRSLRGAIGTVAIALVLFVAMAAPTPVLIGLLLAPAVGGVLALGVRSRGRPGRPVRLSLPWTDRCVQF
ncbi:MAG: hypothetical protein V5A38_06750 [Halolamina sp.]|uniref:hypothetical protein n=1 Tax=Halolamina sp. TaxID=1940283 RepID=UPI002FC33FA5